MAKRSHKTVGIKVLLIIFAWWEKNLYPDPDPYPWLTDHDPGGPKTNGSRSGWIIVAGTLWTTPAPSVSTGRNISRFAPRSSTWRRAPLSWITDGQSDCVMLRDSNQWGGKLPAIGPNHLKTRALKLDNWRANQIASCLGIPTNEEADRLLLVQTISLPFFSASSADLQRFIAVQVKMFHLMRYFYAVKLISLHHFYLLNTSEFDPGCLFCLVLMALALYILYMGHSWRGFTSDPFAWC